MNVGPHSVMFMSSPVFSACLHCLHRQDEPQGPTGTEHISKVGRPGAATLHELPPLHLTPRLSPGHQQDLLAAEACTHQADAQPHVKHQHQEQLQAGDHSWWGKGEGGIEKPFWLGDHFYPRSSFSDFNPLLKSVKQLTREEITSGER